MAKVGYCDSDPKVSKLAASWSEFLVQQAMIIPAGKQANASRPPLVRIAIVTSLANVFEMCGARSIQKQKSVPVASNGIPNIGIHINQTLHIDIYKQGL